MVAAVVDTEDMEHEVLGLAQRHDLVLEVLATSYSLVLRDGVTARVLGGAVVELVLVSAMLRRELRGASHMSRCMHKGQKATFNGLQKCNVVVISPYCNAVQCFQRHQS